MKRLLSLLLAISMLVSSLSGCGAGMGKNETLTVSPEKTELTTKDGVTLNFGDYVLEGESELTVSKLPAEENADEGYKIEAFDISLGELSELGDFITIRIPYDSTYCEEGQNPARCVGAKYRNETTGAWEDVLFEVDEEAQELVIYTDHLSCYGVFYVKNEEKRSAYITDILGSGMYMDKAQTFDFAKKIAEDDPTAVEKLADFAWKANGIFFDYADRIDSAINIVTVGDVPKWLDTTIPETNLTLFSALGYIATCQNLMLLAAKDMYGGVDKGEVLNLIRDVGSKVTTYWADAFTSVGSSALSVGMGGVLVLDKMLTAFAEEAQAVKLEDISFVYHHYNEGFKSSWHKPMTAKDWRAKVIEILEKHPNDPDRAISALEAGFTKYASEFFTLSLEQMNEVASDTPNVTVKRIPNFTESEKNQLIDEYIAHLKDTTMPAVLTSVGNYMLRKTEMLQLQAVNKVKDFFNTKISIVIKEDVQETGSSKYKDYQLRFAPLNKTADARSWTGKWPENGAIETSATLMGFMLAGFPHTVEFFAPDADIEAAEPELVVPFVISVPKIVIEFGGAPSFDELVGNYKGTTVVTEVFVSDSLREQIASGEYSSEEEYGCDIGEVIISLEESIGEVEETEFSIEKSGENIGLLNMGEGGAGDLIYDKPAGSLAFSMKNEEAGGAYSGDLKAAYSADKTGVSVAGDIKATFMFPESDFYIVFRLEGSKPVGQ